MFLLTLCSAVDTPVSVHMDRVHPYPPDPNFANGGSGPKIILCPDLIRTRIYFEGNYLHRYNITCVPYYFTINHIIKISCDFFGCSEKKSTVPQWLFLEYICETISAWDQDPK
jgi:hypothetical protein